MTRFPVSQMIRAGAKIVGPAVAAIVWAALSLTVAAAEDGRVQIAAPGGGRVRALVVGINQYASRSIPTLKGAVADARDLETTLRSAGVGDLTVLIDAEADRRRFEGAMARLINVSSTGDLVIISYAGHGSQTPELVQGSESDGMDEVFLLHGFENAGRNTAERIVDDEMNHWLRQLEMKRVDVLYIADTCHGGGMMRAPDFRSGKLSYRYVPISMDPKGDKLAPVSTASDARLSSDDLPDVTFLAAVNKQSKAPEVAVPGSDTLRGALSYAIARSLSKDEAGPVTRQELFGYARQVTYQYSETRQTIATEPAGSAAKLDKVVFIRKVRAEPDGTLAVATSQVVRMKIYGAAANPLSGIKQGRFPIRIVQADDETDLVWDVVKRDILNRYGDVIAEMVAAADIPAIIDAVGAQNAISKMSEAKPQAIRLLPNDGRFHEGEAITFEIASLKGKYLTLVNISGNGRVRLLFPRLSRDVVQATDAVFRLRLQVEAPFGSDHLVAIVSDQRLDKAGELIRGLDDEKAAGDFVDIVRSLRKSDRNVRIGMAASFTAR